MLKKLSIYNLIIYLCWQKTLNNKLMKMQFQQFYLLFKDNLDSFSKQS